MSSKYGFESPDARHERALALLRKAIPVVDDVLRDLAMTKGWLEPEPTEKDNVMAGWMIPVKESDRWELSPRGERHLPSGNTSDVARLVITMHASEGVDPHLSIWTTRSLSESELERLAKVLRKETTLPVEWWQWFGERFFMRWEK